MKFEVGIVGATGLVGQTIVKCLKEEGLLTKINLTLIATEKSVGKEIWLAGNEYRLVSLMQVENKHFDIVFFSAGDEVSKLWAKKFADNGAFVIDNSGAFRREEGIPLVVPEINMSRVDESTKIISNPNCSTIELAIVLSRLMKISKPLKVIVSTYQSVSGAGREALADLEFGTKNSITQGIKGNIVAQIGDILQDGFCVEEDKMMFETSKILGEHIDVLATTVRVPIPYCHGESVYVKFADHVVAKEIENVLNEDYIKFDGSTPSLPRDVAGTNATHVCRLRVCGENEILMFLVADNLRRGAAYNAVLIAKHIIQNFLESKFNNKNF